MFRIAAVDPRAMQNLFRGVARWAVPDWLVIGAGLVSFGGAAVAWTWSRCRWMSWFLLAWLAGAFIVVSLPGTHYPHYYQLYLPLFALAAGWGVAAMLSTSTDKRTVWGAAGALVVFLLLRMSMDVQFSPESWSTSKYGDIFVEVKNVARAIDRMLPPGETFYVWGTEPGLQYYAGRRPPSGIMWVHRLIYGPLETRARWTQKVLTDLERTKPEMVVLQWNYPPQPGHPVTDWMVENYRLVDGQRLSLRFPQVLVRKGGSVERAALKAKVSLVDFKPVAGPAPVAAAGPATRP